MGGCPGVHSCRGVRELCESVWKQVEPRAHCSCLVSLQAVMSPMMCFRISIWVMGHRKHIAQK